MKLYGLTNSIGYYYVVASDPSTAEKKLMDVLAKADYGFLSHREVTRIDVLAEAPEDNFVTNKFLILNS